MAAARWLSPVGCRCAVGLLHRQQIVVFRSQIAWDVCETGSSCTAGSTLPDAQRGLGCPPRHNDRCITNHLNQHARTSATEQNVRHIRPYRSHTPRFQNPRRKHDNPMQAPTSALKDISALRRPFKLRPALEVCHALSTKCLTAFSTTLGSSHMKSFCNEI